MAELLIVMMFMGGTFGLFFLTSLAIAIGIKLTGCELSILEILDRM